VGQALVQVGLKTLVATANPDKTNLNQTEGAVNKWGKRWCKWG
jgi:hypothetical protein